MNTLNTVSESSNTVTVLMDKLNQACADLADALVMVFDKISEYISYYKNESSLYDILMREVF